MQGALQAQAALQAKSDLMTKGYAIIEDVLSPAQVATAKQHFFEWLDKSPELKAKHRKIDPHGIFKYGQVGHQVHAWYIKTLAAVQEPFRVLWNTTELTTGFDGSCWIPSAFTGKDKIWTHTDQAPDTKGLACVQGFVALTSNEERTLVVYEGSHLLHESYMREHDLTGKKNWQLIAPEYLAGISESKRVLKVKAGSLVLWDSRTFHQNQYGKAGEERIVQYVCFLPKAHKSNSKSQQQKRIKYYEERRTTSHWPYPLNVNGLQPRTYGDKALLLDYTQMPAPQLADLDDKIRVLL
jgi:ectoine hydroxylase-related dioxygenase (phytanoyl-CoA dioxygenase family)